MSKNISVIKLMELPTNTPGELNQINFLSFELPSFSNLFFQSFHDFENIF